MSKEYRQVGVDDMLLKLERLVKEDAPIGDAIVALLELAEEKDKPKAPVKLKGIYPSGQCECPTCGYPVTSFETYMHNKAFGDLERMVRHTKCERCGQVIKWGVM